MTSSSRSSLRQQTIRLPSLAEVEAERCKRSLSYYIRKAWPVVEPATDYIHNWHIDIISEYLTAVTAGEIRNLIINIPPRFMKSLLTSVMWPTWVWSHSPAKRFLTTSYDMGLAVRDAVKSRRIIQSNWYQGRFGDVFELTGDQNAKSRYENDKTGFRYSVGVGGGSTGEGGDFILVDDPLKQQDANSDAIREYANEWWDGTMSTRGNDPKRASRVVIMQRLHEDDLTGHVLDRMKEPGADQYELLCLPMRYEPKRFISTLGLKDPRTREGELLWPERFGEAEVKALEVSLGEMGTAGQLQQRPAPAGGAVFKSEWWSGKNRFRISNPQVYNQVVARWLSFDTAMKDGEENDHTGMTVFALFADYRIGTWEVDWKKLQFPQLAREIEAQAERWNFDNRLKGVIIEDKGSGTTSLQTLRQAAPAWLRRILIAFMPQGSKEYRARNASLWCERGCVLLPEHEPGVTWLFEFEEEHLYKFPASKFDDPEDSFTQGILYLENYLSAGWQARTRAGVA